jgi:hypothetical protein
MGSDESLNQHGVIGINIRPFINTCVKYVGYH